MLTSEFTITRAEMEQHLSQINAKAANAADLVQQISVMAIQYTGFITELQRDIEDLYISIGEIKETPECPHCEDSGV